MPLPSAVTSAIGLPLPSVRITVLPGSAVPLRLLPLLRLTVGVAGAMASTVVLPWPPVLPAGSVAVALTTVPSASGVDGVKLQLPLPSAVTCPIGLPLPSVGATASTVVLAGPLVLPAGSWATALITVPLASGVPGVNVQLPLPSAVAWPIGLPPPSVRITVAPASAVPAITLPLLGSITGAAGATESTVVLAGPLVLPAASWATALTTVPLDSGVPGVKLQLPLPSAVTWPIGLPLPSVRITVAPASAVPAITLPLLGSITGAAGASESTVALVGLLLLPAASWASALITVPLANGVAGVKAQLPLPSAVTWPTGLPLPSVRITVAPASAVPLMTTPLLGSITGAGGAMASTVTLAGPLVLPAGSWATALITVPLASGVPGVNVQLPLPSAVAWPIGLPPPSVRITVAPASAVPLISVPLLGSITGAAGATPSTVITAGALSTLLGLRATTLTTVPSGSGMPGVKDQLPLPSAVTWPIGLPLPSVMMMVLPASAVPLITEPLLGSTCGIDGSEESTVVVAGRLVLPAASLAVTLTTVPLGSCEPGVKLQLPLPSAVVWPIGLPLPSVTVARIEHRGGRGYRVHRGAGRAAGVAGGVLGHRIDHRAVGQRCARGEAPVAAAIGSGLADRVAAAVGEDHRGAGFRGTGDHAAVARVDHRGGRGHRVHRGAGRTAGVAGRVLGHGVDHRAVGQWRARGERPVAAAVGGGLADRVAAAIGEDHRRTGFRGTGDHAAVARVDHRRGRRHRVHRGAGRAAGVAGSVLGHRIDNRAIGQRRAGREAPVAAAIGGDLADRVAVAVGEDHRGTSLGGTGDHATVARIDHRGCWRQRVDGGAGGTAVVAGGVLGQRIDHRAIGQRRSGREGPVAAAVGGDLADRVAVAVGEDHRGPGFRRTADDDSVARIDHRRRRGDGIDGDAGRTAGVAGRVLGHRVDHGAVGQRGARGERPVAAAVGGGLADRVAAAIGEDHRRASFRGTAYLGAVARIDHRRRRGHAIHRDHRRRTVDIAWAARHHVDHRAIRQRDAWSEGPVAAAVGGDLANRVAVAIGDGATASTVVLPCGPVLPAGSWATALTTVPLASGVAGVKVQLPLPSAVVSPIGLPLPSVRITLAPASAVPLMVVPLLGSITGAGGATASTVVAACGPVLPVGSVAVATITVPLASGVPGVKLQLPLPSAVTCPIGLPPASVRVTVAPASAVPLMTTPLLGLITGAGGALESTVTVAGGLLLPAASSATTLTTVPLAIGVDGV
ncbi:hypothetical protein ACS96_30505 [Pseudomonas aeruginosa]|nr:hypothetical protein ACS96_30505 [Pseudomonas aeruginosa]